MPKKYSIILPSYNEAENLTLLLPRLVSVADQYLQSYEIIVVDTNPSLDDTQEVCKKFNVSYINRQPSNYYGDAVRTGIQQAAGERVIFMDSDGSHAPEFLPQFIKDVDKYDLLIASRYIKGGHTENNIALVLMSKILNLFYSRVIKVGCNDISNSFRIYRGNQLKSLELECKNFDIIQEILFKFTESDPCFRIKEIPFSFKKRMHGKSKRSLFVFIISYFKTLIKLLLINKLFKKKASESESANI